MLTTLLNQKCISAYYRIACVFETIILFGMYYGEMQRHACIEIFTDSRELN